MEMTLNDYIQNVKENTESVPKQLNPNAMEFVPSYKQYQPSGDYFYPYTPVTTRYTGGEDRYSIDRNSIVEKRSDFTSTTTLLQTDSSTGMLIAEHPSENVIACHKKKLIDLLTELGGNVKQLVGININLSQDGNGLNLQFVGRDESAHGEGNLEEETSIYQGVNFTMEEGSQSLLDTSASNLLVAQFLKRMGDFINANIKWEQEIQCPSFVALTEDEIERQIEDIKTFDKYFDGSDCGIATDCAFKELCMNLGMPVPSKGSDLSLLADIDEKDEDDESDNEAYCADDESLSGQGELSFGDADDILATAAALKQGESKNSCVLAPDASFVPKAVYPYKSDSGSQLQVNQLSEADSDQILQQIRYEGKSRTLEVPPTTPTMSAMATNIFPAVRIAQNNIQSTTTKPKNKQSLQTRQRPPQTRNNTDPIHSRSTRSTQNTTTTNTIRRVAVPRSAINNSSNTTNNTTINRTLRNPLRKSETRSGITTAIPTKAPSSARSSKPNTHTHTQTHNRSAATGQRVSKIVPRSTTTSMLRQTEVQRRFSLYKAGQNTEIQFNDYLFK